MRKHASSWAVRLLLGILIVSFAVWGIGDVFLGAGDRTTVAEVGELEVELGEVNRAFEAGYRQLNNALGGGIDRQAAVAFGVLDQAVQSAVAERLVDAHAQELGLGVADSELREAIQGNPAFRGLGGFDRQTFDFYLRSLGMTENQYIEQSRAEIGRRALLSAMTQEMAVSETLAAKLAEFRNEQRSGSLLIVESAGIEVDAPDEAALAAYLADNQTAYEAPEYRSGTLIYLMPEDLIAQIEVPEASVREAYDSRMAEFTTPEVREVGQLLAPDRATADKVVAALASESDLAAVADAFSGDGVSYSKIGPVTPDDLPAVLADAAFGVEEGSVSAPVQSDFGFHIFKPITIEAGSQEPFEAVKDRLAEDLALFQARQQLPDVAGRLDDEIAAGEELAAAAQVLELELREIGLVSRQGALKDGGNLDLPREIFTAWFQAEEGETSLLEETDDGGYFMYRVDAIEAARPRALDEVRLEVEAAWLAERRQERARELADELLTAAKGGKDFAELAAGQGQEDEGAPVRLVEFAPVVRSAAGSGDLNRPAIAALFATQKGEVADEVVEVAAGMALVRHGETLQGDREADLAAITSEIGQSRVGEILSEYENHLRQRYPISINQRALEYFTQDPNS